MNNTSNPLSRLKKRNFFHFKVSIDGDLRLLPVYIHFKNDEELKFFQNKGISFINKDISNFILENIFEFIEMRKLSENYTTTTSILTTKRFEGNCFLADCSISCRERFTYSVFDLNTSTPSSPSTIMKDNTNTNTISNLYLCNFTLMLWLAPHTPDPNVYDNANDDAADDDEDDKRNQIETIELE